MICGRDHVNLWSRKLTTVGWNEAGDWSLVHRVNEHVNVIWHEDVSKNREVVLLRCLVDAVGKGLAHTIIF